MPYYTEPVRREPNHRGKLRLITLLGHLPGAESLGFDGDGTPPKRGHNEEGGRKRAWRFSKPLRTPLPDGVETLSEQTYMALKSTREATKPVPPVPSEPTPDPLEALEARIAALEGGSGVRP